MCNMEWVKFIKCDDDKCIITIANSESSGGYYRHDTDYKLTFSKEASPKDYLNLKTLYDKW